jgi:hypothetical protein
MQEHLLIEHIYNALKSAVKFYSENQSHKCKRPNTFAVLNSQSELSTENLGKTKCDANLPYFYSRAWGNNDHNPSRLGFDWPLVAAFEQGVSIENVFRKNETCYDVQLMCLDSLAADCNDCDCKSCAARTSNQIFADTETILMNVLQYIENSSVYTDANNNLMVLNENHFEYLVLNNAHESYVLHENFTGRFKTLLRQKNTNVTAFRFEGKAASNLYGTIINLKFCFDKCYNPAFDFLGATNAQFGIDYGCC